jgi:two-component system, response regulator PdtaR
MNKISLQIFINVILFDERRFFFHQGGIFMQTTIVIADDDTILRKDLKAELQQQGYFVIGEANNGIEAISRTRELLPDLVIMDMKMPEMDGIAASKIILQEKIAPVLILSAYQTSDLIEQAKTIGISQYLLKPWHPSTLKFTIDSTLARVTKQHYLEEKIESLENQILHYREEVRNKGNIMEQNPHQTGDNKIHQTLMVNLGLTSAEAWLYIFWHRSIDRDGEDNREDR